MAKEEEQPQVSVLSIRRDREAGASPSKVGFWAMESHSGDLVGFGVTCLPEQNRGAAREGKDLGTHVCGVLSPSLLGQVGMLRQAPAEEAAG